MLKSTHIFSKTDGVCDVVLQIPYGLTKDRGRDDRRYVGLVSPGTVSLGNGEHDPRLVHAKDHPNTAPAVVDTEQGSEGWREGDTALDHTINCHHGLGNSDVGTRCAVFGKLYSLWLVVWKHSLWVTLYTHKKDRRDEYCDALHTRSLALPPSPPGLHVERASLFLHGTKKAEDKASKLTLYSYRSGTIKLTSEQRAIPHPISHSVRAYTCTLIWYAYLFKVEA